jgi:glucose/arabinose dehydrogenase/plastocyanin
LTALAVSAIANAEIHEVVVRNFEFAPAAVTAAPGDTVRWVWESGFHTVTSGAGCTYDGLYFDVASDSANPEFEFVIPDGVLEIPYFCRPHCVGGMTGLITVDPDIVDFVITLDGDQVVPPVDTPASGSGTARLFPSTSELSWAIEFSGLTGTQTAAHFHGAARQCENVGVQIGLPLGSPIVGSATLTPQQVSDLLAGLWYTVVHTDVYPGGEIRGQVMPAPLVDPIPAPIPAGAVYVELETAATGLTAPNWGTFAPGQAGQLFVSDQNGTLWRIDLTTGEKSVFLDASSRLVALGVFGPDSFDERGLLGVAFHPDYRTNGLLYTYTSEPESGAADFSTIPLGESPNHQTVILEWQVASPADPNAVVDPASARELLRIDQPQFNHNAGCLNFGPDGNLYIALGDGGGADDKDGQTFIGTTISGHGCAGNGADSTTALGTILRIDPLGGNSANGQYGIPGDNPFVGIDGVDEIYAYGFRNPFRFSFDSATGDLYVGDVGQNDVEEIDLVVSGGNYGWNHKEGSFFFVANGNQPGYVTDVPLDVPGGLVDPVAEYDHNEGIAIVGGFVYRGAKIPALAGRYVFGDFAVTFSNDGRLFYLDGANTINELQLVGQPELGLSLLGFGQDADGELYVLANSTGTPFGTTGVVLRIRALPGDLDADGDVDLSDLAELLGAYGTCAGDPGFNPAADFNDDGCVSLADLAALLGNYTG